MPRQNLRGVHDIKIEVLRCEPPNEYKQFLHRWYTKLGYVEEATYTIAERIPEPALL